MDIIIHGSENSLDVDGYVIIPQPLDKKEAKKICDSITDINANLICVNNGEVTWSYKGTIDECNNSIFHTYSLHNQTIANPITHTVSRQYALKMLRTVRGILSYNSRTNLRTEIKKALISDDFTYRINILKMIDLVQVNDFDKNTKIEAYKFLAFQMGQTLALLQDNEELFTKNLVANKYPSLKKYLDRVPNSDPLELQEFLTDFCNFLNKSYSKVDEQLLFITNFHGNKEIFDCKKEIILPPVVVFDIDGTLANEEHRAHFRENKKWEHYFEACDLDIPMQNIIDLTHFYKEKGYEVWLMSGRVESCKEKTINWMKQHNVVFDHIKLRANGVFLPDYVLKPAWIKKYIGKERVELIYDDTDAVIEAFREKGLNVIDVKTQGNHYKNKLK